MNTVLHPWDYLIVTASNAAQARAYRAQLDVRSRLGLVQGVKEILVVPDPEGKRIGSGGSTIRCWMEVLRRETEACPPAERTDPETWKKILSGLRILIVHAGGDSRRLPAYGPCGKLFVPVPGESNSALGETLFDRQLPTYLELPPPENGAGHTVITTGDVLLFFDPREVRFQAEGFTGIGSWVSPEVARNHGVFCADETGRVLAFTQKPSPQEQETIGCLNRAGHALLDIGVMSICPNSAVRLLNLSRVKVDPEGAWDWSGQAAQCIATSGLDVYREICCALGEKTECVDYIHGMRKAGVKHEQAFLLAVFEALSGVPFLVNRLSACEFLHFGTMNELIHSGNELQRRKAVAQPDLCIRVNSRVNSPGEITGGPAWVDGCLVESTLALAGPNVVLGADIQSPLSLPAGACLDILKGKERTGGRPTWFVRLYDIADDFKASVASGAVYCGRPIAEWLTAVGADEDAVWDAETRRAERSLWSARLFPGASSPSSYTEWLWMLNPQDATSAQKSRWRESERYSAQEMANLADQDDFFRRRWAFRGNEIFQALARFLWEKNSLSAVEISFIWENLGKTDLALWGRKVWQEALGSGNFRTMPGLERLVMSRIVHTLASSIQRSSEDRPDIWSEIWPPLAEHFNADGQGIFEEFGISSERSTDVGSWCRVAKDAAFINLSRTIVRSAPPAGEPPRKALRGDEIVWGRAPARFDLGGGWTDTPPYTLENGGCVINAAVNLNGQPPIQVYARVIPEPEVRIASIDHGTRITIASLEELLDYREPTSSFGLAKAALALSGFCPSRAVWPENVKTLEQMLTQFGGGVELTTLAAIPSGSGLGTSSIMGAVLMSVIARLRGVALSDRDLFHAVLQLEQELTTGGGWQDQIGGTVPGVKMITTDPGLVPNPRVHSVPDDLLDPAANEGRTLLYYTGMRRLAKNILRGVVGRYLDRSRDTLYTLSKLHAFPPEAVEALSRKDIGRFGKMIDTAWRLNKQLDPESSNPEVESILARFKPYMLGAKLLGAGGGGFLLVVCESPAKAAAARQDLTENPPNPLARFFEFSISRTGLEVTVC